MKESLNPEEKKILVMWGIVGCIVFALALCYKFIYVDSKEKKYEDEEYRIVEDYDRYYTVMGAINKFYSFYNASSYDKVLNILNSKYKNENSITDSNIKEFFPENSTSINFKGNIMCFKDLDDGITSYIVEGNDTEMNTGKALDKRYYNVILDGNQFAFSIEPIDEEFYGGNCNE